MAGMLEGIRVLEPGQALAGPDAGAILADFDCARHG
jgi:crotonobetainyl-CoA:carnitine CoA-transferase CaiB-like acyl-CoA transferase